MKISENQVSIAQLSHQSYCEDCSFKLVSNILTKALGRNSQEILISSKAGSFLHDHATGVEITATTYFSIHNCEVNEREKVTEIFVDGTSNKRNGDKSSFTIFFHMKRKFLIMPEPLLIEEAISKNDIKALNLHINGMVYNSIFSLDLTCNDKKGYQYSLGEGRGYLIFDEPQQAR